MAVERAHRRQHLVKIGGGIMQRSPATRGERDSSENKTDRHKRVGECSEARDGWVGNRER
ncbi:hypothetical protein L484_010551 [Morus notabilis]|uniref:Uncharacterized protein n=1 Tax=Morus notabilis TaxID=981085 RepID=W9SLC3_9ROSA|nr:hypothetical protein L484_010551 [Morus notabilis]